VAGFREHLGRAGEGDTALFYFAGHGTQEDADPEIWPFESDGKLECIVNYDGIQEVDGEEKSNLLADKELRYLLHELAQTKAHVITIFDCCHSGGNTRKLKLDKEEEVVTTRQYVSSRLTKAAPGRPWEQFLFADTVSKEDLRTLPLPRVIPAGQHVHMSACRSDQLAYEVGGGGIFTSTLLDLLRDSKSQLSYFDLRNRIRYMVKSAYKQTPEVYVQGEQPFQLFSGFLGKNVERKLNEANFVYNKKEGWVLDMGAMHGLSPDLKTIEIEDAEGGEPFKAEVQSVKMAYTRLLIQDPEVMTRLDPGKTYRVLVPGALAQPIRIYLDAEGEAAEGMNFIRTNLKETKDRQILVDSEQDADYVIRIANGEYLITNPGESIPLVKPVEGIFDRSARLVASYLRHISKWTFVRDLHNPNVKLFKDSPLEIEFFQVEDDLSRRRLELKGEELLLHYKKFPTGEWGNKLRVRITNRHSSEVYCSLIYISQEFQVYSSMLGEPSIVLRPGASVWAYDGEDIELFLPDYISFLKRPNSYVWLKFIVSTSEFQPAVFDMDPLPMPTEDATRSIKLKPLPKIDPADWTTQLVEIRMPNPEV
jgi:hypothetical protein